MSADLLAALKDPNLGRGGPSPMENAMQQAQPQGYQPMMGQQMQPQMVNYGQPMMPAPQGYQPMPMQPAMNMAPDPRAPQGGYMPMDPNMAPPPGFVNPNAFNPAMMQPGMMPQQFELPAPVRNVMEMEYMDPASAGIHGAAPVAPAAALPSALYGMPSMPVADPNRAPADLRVPISEPIVISAEDHAKFSKDPAAMTAFMNAELQKRGTQIFQQTLTNAEPYLMSRMNQTLERKFAVESFYQKYPRYRSMPNSVTRAILMAKAALPFADDQTRLSYAAQFLESRERQLTGYGFQPAQGQVHNAIPGYQFAGGASGGRATMPQVNAQMAQAASPTEVMMAQMIANANANRPMEAMSPRQALGRRTF